MSTTTADPGAAAPSAPFDVAELARLANEMFRALPGASTPEGGSAALKAAVPPPVLPHPVAPALSPPATPPGFGRPLDAGVASAGLPPPGVAAGSPAAAPFTPPAPSLNLPGLSQEVPGQAELRALSALLQPSAPGGPGFSGAPSYYFAEPKSGKSGPTTSGRTPDSPSGAAPVALDPHPGFDVAAVRRDFPILKEKVNGKPLIWLDNAATTQKPQAVIDRLAYFYAHENSNIHRAAHELAARATDAYEDARDTVRRFLNAGSPDEIVYVRGATEAINLVAQSWGRANIGEGDEIIVSHLEHHANIVPWQLLAAEKGAKLRVIPVDDRGQVLLDEYQKLLTERVKLVSFTQVSNALGTVTPAAQMVAMARQVGAHTLVDGAQAVSHMAVDVQALDCDWYVFSGHKVFGPTGIGALYGKAKVLEKSPPWQGGGNMIRDVTFEKTEYHGAPAKFEAGTGNIADAAGLAAALDYVMRIGMDVIARHEHDLLVYGTRLLSEISGLRLIGTAAEKAGVLSFVIDGIPPEEVGKALNQDGIAVRSGHHCAQPILRRFGLEASVRPSLALYNTYADLDALADSVRRVRARTSPVN
jgi:cysteine desulfurase / selenocysteine lyase